MRALSFVTLLTLASCSSTSTPDAGAPAPDAGPPDAGEDAGPGCVETDAEVITFTTDDGVALEADLYVPATPSGAAVALFHMIPPANDRLDYQGAFIPALLDRGLIVLNVDRRGAGGSEGDPMEAYLGPNGKLDVAAAVAFLEAHPCAPTSLGLVGASNGTTSVLDYTVYAASEAGATSPSALVFLTGGAYTEAQNAIADHRGVLDPLPLLFVFSTAERDWSAGFEAGAPATWRFDEHADGAHGTFMFSAVPQSVDDVAGFLADSL